MMLPYYLTLGGFALGTVILYLALIVEEDEYDKRK